MWLQQQTEESEINVDFNYDRHSGFTNMFLHTVYLHDSISATPAVVEIMHLALGCLQRKENRNSAQKFKHLYFKY